MAANIDVTAKLRTFEALFIVKSPYGVSISQKRYYTIIKNAACKKIMKKRDNGMDLVKITDFLNRCIDEPGGNYVRCEDAISPELVSLKMYDSFAIGVASWDDGCFLRFKEPGVVGSAFLSPREWLPEARSVISVFFRAAPSVAASNAILKDLPSPEWLHARYEGQSFISSAMTALAGELEKNGFAAAVPQSDPRFAVKNFVSNWSERHVAYACGLGTFGLSKGLITRCGMAGRLGSVVTSLDLPPTARSYGGVYDWCVMCGACVKNCPAGAISLEKGKDHGLCSAYIDTMREKFAPRYGCGKCQVGVPCQDASPAG
jgi:ferredoxin